jgi:hypothetical protein
MKWMIADITARPRKPEGMACAGCFSGKRHSNAGRFSGLLSHRGAWARAGDTRSKSA